MTIKKTAKADVFDAFLLTLGYFSLILGHFPALSEKNRSAVKRRRFSIFPWTANGVAEMVLEHQI